MKLEELYQKYGQLKIQEEITQQAINNVKSAIAEILNKPMIDSKKDKVDNKKSVGKK